MQKIMYTSDEQSQIQLDFLQRHIYNLLLKGDLNVEKIAELARHPLSEVSAALTMMELGGHRKSPARRQIRHIIKMKFGE